MEGGRRKEDMEKIEHNAQETECMKRKQNPNKDNCTEEREVQIYKASESKGANCLRELSQRD